MFDKPITKEELLEWIKDKHPIDEGGEYPDDRGNYESFEVYEADDNGTTRLFKVEFCNNSPYPRWDDNGPINDYRPHEVEKIVEMVEQITYEYKDDENDK